MTPITEPVHLDARHITDAWTALPSWLPVPGLGALPINAFLLKGREPVLVDTGLAALSDAMVDRLSAEIDLVDLRWIWLSHTDADHIGNLDRILSLAPNASVVTNFLGAGKMGMMGKGNPERLRLLEPGEVFEVGGHRLHQVKPPYYDAPETMGFFDEADRVLFAADAFGALLPGSVDTIEEVPEESLREGLVAWSSVDAPWLAQIDRGSLGRMLRALDALEPAHVLSGHLPVAHRLDTLTEIVRGAYGRGTTAAVTPETAVQVEAILA
ncbi:MBL fold metallo-hydrolase [Defluviimonas sp. WL0002]|uniref:MBL fold metallo-hydrolase n=1 Tax=Albidovulum marisflavi TaxID=2984159 RepID=A0ABT2ZFI6_9RHOB|nr:MBL fold metallo-hydrolase [Defluviimonas sp. WL0002]MCV2869893.1 MBL fold metallo-hydrolase [Defluviimonas sp. WL0002]